MKIILKNVGDFCSNDPHVYQACWVTSQTLDRGQLEKTNDERLCANYLCSYKPYPRFHFILKIKFIKHIFNNCDGAVAILLI